MNPDTSTSPQPGQSQPNSAPAAPSAASGPLPMVDPAAYAPAPGFAPPSPKPLNEAQETLLRHNIAQAEEIVARTAQDPFLQVQELERLKATYINSRFGKNIKISDN